MGGSDQGLWALLTLGIWGGGRGGGRVQGLGFRVQVLGFRVQSLGFRVQVLGFRVQGLGLG